MRKRLEKALEFRSAALRRGSLGVREIASCQIYWEHTSAITSRSMAFDAISFLDIGTLVPRPLIIASHAEQKKRRKEAVPSIYVYSNLQ